MAAIPSYRAEMIGLSERDRTLLRSLLAASQARTGIRWDGGAAQPAVHFVDVEGQAGAEFWQSLSDADRRDGAIAIAGAAPAGAAHWLPKPLRSASLLGVLEKMTLTARTAAGPAAVTPAPSTQRPAVRAPKPGEPLGLLDILDGAPGAGARTVQSVHWPDLVLGNGNTHAMRTAAIDQYTDGFAASLEVARVTKYTGGPMDDDLRIEVDTLRWLAFLYAPGTEIAERLPPVRRARLRKPPAFAHLPHKSHHVRMAAWLTQHAATPQELAEATGVDPETVLRFLGACAAIGLLDEIADVVAAAPPVVVAPAPAPRPIAAPTPAEPAASAAAVAAPIAAATPPVSPPPAAESPPDAAATPTATAGTSSEEPTADAPASEGGSVLERLRAAREQNRARVAAAIRNISNH